VDWGGLLAGGAAGSVIRRRGSGDLLKQFQQSGQGEVANSWVSPGPEQIDFRPAILAKGPLGRRSDR